MSLTIYEWLEDFDEIEAYDREEKLKDAVEEYNALYGTQYSQHIVRAYLRDARLKQWGEE